MGLDWLVNSKPKLNENNESNFYKIKNKIKRLDNENNEENENEIDDLRERLKEISISPEDTINSLTNLGLEEELNTAKEFLIGGSFLTSNYDFRGGLVSNSDLISEKLTDEAYKNHGAKASIKYADKLEKELSEYIYDELDEEEKEDYDDIILAIKWLRFWGNHGHGFSAWY